MEVANNPIDERFSVISAIRDGNQATYEVLTNLDKDVNYIGQIFPDLILRDKTTKLPVFIIEVKRNGQVAQCIQQWKSAPSIPATLYIVVPETELQNAKSVASVVGLQTKFGWYKVTSAGVTVKYE
ncbi:MAG: hypothetical protein WDN75_11780 [Bacteroidota bacterium]